MMVFEPGRVMMCRLYGVPRAASPEGGERFGAALQRSFYHRGTALSARGSCDHAIFVETALQRAVVERSPAARLEPDQFGQTGVPAKQISGPARKALLERIAQPR